jgi:hypothetical protein
MIGELYRDSYNRDEVHLSKNRKEEWLLVGPIPFKINLNKAKFHQEHHLSGTWNISPNWNLSVQAYNLGDAFFEDGYLSIPYPRRRYFLTTNLTF